MANLNIPNFLGGVSKQPFTQRQVNEAQEQINCYNSLSDGLVRRPPSFQSVNFNQLNTITDIKSFKKLNESDIILGNYELGKYIIQDQINNLYTVNTFGETDNILFESAQVETDFKNYANQSVDEELQYLTINDAIFVYNPEVTVLKDNINLTPTVDTERNIAYAYVASSDINRKYKIFLDYTLSGFDFQYQLSYTPTAAESTETIARKLISSLENYPDPSDASGFILSNGNYYDVPTELEIQQVDSSNFPDSFDITVTGDLYYEDEDVFKRETKIYSIVAGTSKFVTPEKWGSMKSATTPTIRAKEIVARTPAGYVATLPYYESQLISTGLSLGGLQVDINVRDSVVKIQRNAGQTFTFEINNLNVTDDFNNQNMYQIFGTMQSIDLLPPKFYHDEKVKISGNPLTNTDDYYVKFQVNNSTTPGEYGSGVWIESIAGGIEYQYDLTTMPFVIKNVGGTKTIDYGDWNELGSRVVGDDNTNPYPSFVDNKITTMFIFGNRLCTASENKITMSQSGNLYNFFQTSVVSLLPSDPIDVTITSDKNIKISHAIPFQERLLLIADDAQFNMVYNDVLTIDTLKVIETSTYNTSNLIKPLKTNNLIFFVSDYGVNTQVNEFFYDDIALVNGNILTDRIEDYIPNGMDLIDVNKANDTLVLSKKGTSEIFVYQYIIKNKERLLSSWHKWEFTGLNIQRIGFWDDSLTIFFKDSSGAIQQMYLDLVKDIDIRTIYLDNIIASSTASTPISNISTITYPGAALYADPNEVAVITYDSGYDLPFGYSHEIIDTRIIGDDIVIDFKEPDPSWDTSKIYGIGFNYNSEYEFSTLILRDENGRTINRGRTQLLNQVLTYGNTSGFIYETQVLKGDLKEQVFLAGRLGNPSNVLDEKIVETGSERFYLGSKNTDLKQKIKSINELGFRIESSEVELRFWDRRI